MASQGGPSDWPSSRDTLPEEPGSRVLPDSLGSLHGSREENLLIGELISEALERWQEIDHLRDFVGYRAIARRGPEVVKGVALVLLERIEHIESTERQFSALEPTIRGARRAADPSNEVTAEERLILRYLLLATLALVLSSKPAFSATELARLLQWLTGPRKDRLFVYPASAIVRAAERRKAAAGLLPDHKTHLARLRQMLLTPGAGRRDGRLAERVRKLLGEPAEIPIEAGDAWADRVRAELAELGESEARAWTELLRHAARARKGEPSESWRRKARAHLDAVGEESFVRHALAWWEEIGGRAGGGAKERSPQARITARNADVLKGLAWACTLIAEPRFGRVLASAAEASFRRVPGKGPRSLKVGNACIASLSSLPGLDAVSQLFRLRDRVRLASARKRIDQGLERAAKREELEIDDLEELSVPSFGFDKVGAYRESFDYYEALLEVVEGQKIELLWRGQDGKVRKSVPAAVREGFPERLAELRGTVKDARKMLSAQRERFERLLLTDRGWELETWRQRYLLHPLAATLSRRLIWAFQLPRGVALGIWHHGKLVSARGEPIYGFTEDTRVRLWHPIGFDRESVLAWRCWLEEQGVVQPFKQAHRELYVLTEAELETRHYSNRFAAHVLKQHQFASLAKARGWRFDLAGTWSYSRAVAEKELTRWRIRAEFWVDAVGGEDSYAESGAALYLGTDQVRFYDASSPQEEAPLPLTEVPALVFTEVMRDVDLFVGVASIGNDPAWMDGGGNGEYQDYWYDYSFGDLTQAAKTRREVIERLLPRLTIAPRCEIVDRFLVVRGQLRTYKIHLGSGNILMEPNNQYLCIVQDRNSASNDRDPRRGDLRLPFEGDATLSVILSKAFLLAADDRIEDRTILEQIRQG